MCRLVGATCPRSAPRNQGYPPKGAGYLRVVLGEEVGPVCRRGDAYDKYSLDCEEAENAVRLRADRHFPLNIQETGINKRRTGRTVSRSWAKNNRAPEGIKKCVVGGDGWRRLLDTSAGSEISIRDTEDWQLKTRETRMKKMLCRCCWCAWLLICALAVLPPSPPPRSFAPSLSHSLQCNDHTGSSWPRRVECSHPAFQNKTFYALQPA